MHNKIVLFILITVACLSLLFFLFLQLIPRDNISGPFAMFRGQRFKKGNIKYLIIGLLIGVLAIMISIFE
jgi:hypothetical protein